MKNDQMPKPPGWAERFLSWYCRPELLEDLQGDLHEFFERNVQAKGIKRAKLIYIIDVLKFFRPYTIRKPRIKNPLLQQYMIRSYAKTSGRNIMRHKLFSGINIAGLAISMCVGLLVISFLSDLYSYDDFHKKKDRIYCVVSSDANNGRQQMNLATSSYGAGKKIQQTIPGIETMTFIRRGFSGDAVAGETTVPLSGFWATESFFDVFSFQLLKGNPYTALQKPNSLLLTEVAAKKLFGNSDVVGRVVKFDTINYIVTGVIKDIPKLSLMRFEALVSMSTIEGKKTNPDEDMLRWEDIVSNYTYLVLPENGNPAQIQGAMNKLAAAENAHLKDRKITLALEPLNNLILAGQLGNQVGPAINKTAVYILGGLAFIVIISACFNYTNLSIARSLNRSKEVGIRKVIGAQKGHVLGQFITESIIISLLALSFAFILFLLLRQQFLSLDFYVQNLVSLQLTPKLIIYFILFAVFIGFIAGILPALFYSRIKAIQVLTNVTSLKVFRHVSLRKSLIVVQYTFSLIFITATVIGYNQYRSFITYDLGFSTQNILNINMQGNKSDVLIKELSAMPVVKEISKSSLISSLGSISFNILKYNDPQDSAFTQVNFIDEHYLTVHQYKLLAGKNFGPHPVKGMETEAIVNEQLLKRFNIGNGDPQKAIGEMVNIAGNKLAIVAVLKDFHYGTLENKIEPVIFRYSGDDNPGYINVKIEASNLSAALAGVNDAWRKVDKIHPLNANFYDAQIEDAYSFYSVIIRVIGFCAFLAIVIASMGLFGMVVYSTEKRLKEISIRKVIGAGERTLIYLMSKNFLLLLILSALIALPVTWLFFENVVLVNIAFHQPLQLGEALLGFLIVLVIAGIMIGLQTLKAARTNPVKVLKRE